MAIRVLFWNIENYVGNPERTEILVDHIQQTNPDIVGFSEIKNKAALRSVLQQSLIEYDFGITDGKEGIELLAGWKRSEFEQALFTQRREFKAGNPDLRPGSLLSVNKQSKFFNLLFLHTDSGRKNKDYSNRQDMFEKIWAMREKLADIEGGSTNFAVLGDLNTMGRQAGRGLPEITASTEISDLGNDAIAKDMRLLDKSHQNTWARVNSAGEIKLQSNLDHVLVSSTIDVGDAGDGHAVLVRGWVDAQSDAERHTFVEEVSDHCSIEIVLKE